MAANLNKVLLIGNLTRDPELRYLTSGRAVATFSVAVNRNYTTQSGEKKEDVTFIRVVTWDKRAEVCNEYLKKGSPVFVEGRLQTRTWEAQDGAKRSTTEVVASSIQFLNRGTGQRSTAPQGAEAPAADDVQAGGDDLPHETHNEEEVPF